MLGAITKFDRTELKPTDTIEKQITSFFGLGTKNEEAPNTRWVQEADVWKPVRRGSQTSDTRTTIDSTTPSMLEPLMLEEQWQGWTLWGSGVERQFNPHSTGLGRSKKMSVLRRRRTSATASAMGLRWSVTIGSVPSWPSTPPRRHAQATTAAVHRNISTQTKCRQS